MEGQRATEGKSIRAPMICRSRGSSVAGPVHPMHGSAMIIGGSNNALVSLELLCSALLCWPSPSFLFPGRRQTPHYSPSHHVQPPGPPSSHARSIATSLAASIIHRPLGASLPL